MATTDLSSAVLQTIQQAAEPVAATLHMPNMTVVDEGTLGDFPWYWQVGTNFNAKTYNWLNNVFAYNSTDQYLDTDAANFMTAYFNVLMDASYVLNAADNNTLNAAVLQYAAVANTVITDWTTTQGPIPATYTTQAGQLNYITGQVLLWGNAGLTLGQLRNSTNPMSLLPNVPVGANQIVSDLMTYLADTSSVANIQAAVVSANNQLAQTRLNVSPSPATATAGWMTTVNSSGATQIVPQFNIVESTAQIQNNLLPTGGQGLHFTASMSASKSSSSTVQVTAQGGIAGAGDVDFFLTISAGASASYSLWTIDTSVTTVDISLAFNGVTTVTPQPASYSISTATGWWNPEPIQSAVAYDPSVSGYRFTPEPQYNFGADGTFGLISRLMISQQPVLTLVFHTSNYSAFQQIFTEQSHWGISFLGIPIAGGSQSYYSAQTSQQSTSNTVTVTLTPVGITTPLTPTDQLAYVIGAEVLWPGAPEAIK